MDKIEALTPEQEILRQAWHKRWFEVGSSCEQVDRPRAEAAISAMYTEINKPAPRFLWVQSPATGCLAISAIKQMQEGDSLWDSLRASLRASLGASLRDSLWASLRDSLGDSLWDSLRASLRDSLRASLWDSLRASLWDSLRDSLWASLWDSLRDSLWAALRDSLRASLWASLRDSLGDSLWASLRDSLGDSLRASLWDSLGECFWGQQESAWISFYLFCRELGVKFDPAKSRHLGLWSEVAQSCGWWWPFDGTCIVSDRPAVVKWELDRTPPRLHCETGPALLFRDGWEVYSWHGLRVPKKLIEERESITPADIHAEKNQELRRAMFEIVGWDRYLRDAGAKKVSDDDAGELLEVAGLGDGDPVARFVRVKCPSTGREYALRVPPQTETARAGVAWTFGVEAEKYHPAGET